MVPAIYNKPHLLISARIVKSTSKSIVNFPIQHAVYKVMNSKLRRINRIPQEPG